MRGFNRIKSLSWKQFKSVGFYFIPCFLFLIFVELVALNNYFLQEIEKGKIKTNPLTINLKPYPFLESVLGFSTFKNQKAEEVYPSISAEAASIIDNDSQVVLFSKNSGLRFSMASTTKIMTSLVALDYYKSNDILQIQSEEVEGARVGFKKGDAVRFEDMLYGLLLPSGNDAALAIAQNYLGGEEKFVEKMNEKAASLHLYNTHFADPTGLSDEGNFSTVTDLARLASFAIQNPVFAKVVDTKQWVIKTVNTSATYSIKNLNKLLGADGVTGIKTGYTEEAGEVLVTSKNEKGHTLIIVVMKSENRFGDTQKLLRFVSGNIIYKALSPTD